MSLPQNELIRQTTISTLDHKDPHGPESDAGATQATADNASDAGKAGGVKRAEALYQVFGRKGKGVWLLWATIFLIAYVYELSNVLSFNFLAFATSSFGQHANLSTANVAVYVVGAIGQPFIAKFADVTSRPLAYLFSLVFYVIGFLVVATAKTVWSVAGGQVLYTVGSTGLTLMNSLIVADLTSLQNRGLFTSFLAVPWIINAYISGYMVDGLGVDGWRWGFGMFAIIMPVVVAPALAILFWADLKARRMGIGMAVPEVEAAKANRPLSLKIKDALITLDAIGLLLLGFAWALILLPFTLSSTAKDGYKNPSLIAMFVVGGVLLVVFGVYEKSFAKYPIMPMRLLNRTFICCVTIDVLYLLSAAMNSTYWSSWLYVATEWTLFQWTIFNNTLTVCLCVFGVAAGLVMKYTHNYKWSLVFGVAIRCLSGAMQLVSTKNRSNGVLACVPIFGGLGGGFSVVASQVAVQASVPHVDMASAMANLALWSQLGTAIGTAIAGAVWTNRMPIELTKRLSPLGVTAEQIAEIYGSITVAKEEEGAIREGVIAAYNVTVRPLYIAALILCIVPIVTAWLTEDFYLGKTQNAVDGRVHAMYAEEEQAGSSNATAVGSRSVPADTK